MTIDELIGARDGTADATVAATAAWTAITGRVSVHHAATALDTIGAKVGRAVDVPAHKLTECVVRTGLWFRNTESTAGLSSYMDGATTLATAVPSSPNPLRASGALSILAPYIRQRAAFIR